MGYNSEVCVRFDIPTRMTQDSFIKRIEKDCKCKLSNLFDKIYKKDKVLYLYTGWVKWYNNFPDVENFENFVHNFEDKFKTGGVHFIRIGEDLGDIDDYSFGNPSDYISIIEQVDFNGIDKMIDIEEEI